MRRFNFKGYTTNKIKIADFDFETYSELYVYLDNNGHIDNSDCYPSEHKMLSKFDCVEEYEEYLNGDEIFYNAQEWLEKYKNIDYSKSSLTEEEYAEIIDSSYCDAFYQEITEIFGYWTDWNNKEIVLKAIEENYEYLFNASYELRNNKEIVVFACKQDIQALEYASNQLLNDDNFINELKAIFSDEIDEIEELIELHK